MRVFGTIIFGLIFVVVFIGALLLHSLVSFPTNSDAIVEVVKAAEVHKGFSSALEQVIEKEVDEIPDPQVRKVIAENAKSLGDFIGEEWFHEAIGAAHAAAVALVIEGDASKTVDLRPLKKGLSSFATKVRDGIKSRCDNNPEDCGSAEQIQSGMATFDTELDEMLAKIPDEPSIQELADIAKLDISAVQNDAEATEMREKYGQAKMGKYVMFGIALLILGLIALVNSTNTARILVNVGVVLAISGLLYLVVSGPGGDALLVEVQKDMAPIEDSSPDAAGERIGQQVAIKAFEELFSYSNWIAYVALGGGALMLVGGIVIGSRTEKDPLPA